MSTGPLRVACRLTSPLAGEPPQLDALLEWALSPLFAPDRPSPQGHFKITRSGPAPKQGALPIPLAQVWIGPWLVACCSNPILPVAAAETVEHVAKRLAVEHAGLLAPAARLVVSTTNSWTKSYRLPLRVRAVDRIVWLASGNRRKVQKALRDVKAVGKKVSDGYGRVAEWLVKDLDGPDRSWWAPHPSGQVLMRTLPLLIDGREWLPKDLLGWRRDYAACRPPYWHPERRAEVVVPC